MPIRIPDGLPAQNTLKSEGVHVLGEADANRQDIRPLQIGLLNLMPNKIRTEAQIARLIGATPLQVELTLVRIGSHKSKNTHEDDRAGVDLLLRNNLSFCPEGTIRTMQADAKFSSACKQKKVYKPVLVKPVSIRVCLMYEMSVNHRLQRLTAGTANWSTISCCKTEVSLCSPQTMPQ